MAALGRLFGMTETDKFSAYIRLSMHAALVALAVLSFRPVLGWPDASQSALVVLVALVNCVFAVLVIERTPAFSTASRCREKLYPIAIGLNVLCWAIAVGILAMQRAPHIAGATNGLAVFLLSSFAFVLTIHLKYAYLIVTALGVITATVVEHPTLDRPSYIVAFALLLVWGTKVTEWSVGIVKELDRTRGLQSQLKVHEERLRFAQELHDSLGQHLAAMSLKTQLAISLYEKDADRAKSELHELEKLVRLMREDLHQVVTGYRTLYPHSELEAASSLLEGAGISVSVSGSPQDIPEACQQTAAWFIREATTNVMKHSNASAVDVSFSAHGVSISNDGAKHQIGSLGGMQTLQERARKIDGTISLTHHNNQFTAALSWKDSDG